MSTYLGIERAEHVIDQYLDDLKNIVNIDSGTYNKQGVDRVGQYLQQRSPRIAAMLPMAHACS